MDLADVILLHFEPDTKSPITQLELGLHKNKCVVHCPPGFWRKGNVDIVCRWFDIDQAESVKQGIERVQIILGRLA